MDCTLQGIFQKHFEAYAARHRLPAYVHRAAYWNSESMGSESVAHRVRGRMANDAVSRRINTPCLANVSRTRGMSHAMLSM